MRGRGGGRKRRERGGSAQTTVRPSSRVPPVGLGEGVGGCLDVVVNRKGAIFGSSGENSEGTTVFFRM